MKPLKITLLLIGAGLLAYSIYVVKEGQKKRDLIQERVQLQEEEVLVQEEEIQNESTVDALDKKAPVNTVKPQAKSDNSLLRDSIVNFGMELLETPYITAGTSRDGFDCSGFVYFVFGQFDIEVPRSSINFSDFGEEISVEKVKKGDILLFLSPTRNKIGHVGIVSKANGKKSEFIHASSGKSMAVVISSLTSKGYSRRFVKAIRVL